MSSTERAAVSILSLLDDILTTVPDHHWDPIRSWPPDRETELQRAVLREDPSIAIVWGVTIVEDFSEEWANSFADPHARSFYAYVLRNGEPIYQDFLVSVDGGRAYLPPPHTGTNRVPWNRYRLAALVDGLSSAASEFESYWERSGLETDESYT